ncbi:hypothetical protein [Floridanema evergladense]|uniref:Uncharacterized protein n=1 Tax=Floridaenema evergladense BLCC-F167 TaxID=3153639 RepID=A0ABV4WEI1_9CYAN
MNYFDNGEFLSSALMLSLSSLPSNQIIGWQIIEESLAWPRPVMSNAIMNLATTSFIQIHP